MLFFMAQDVFINHCQEPVKSLESGSSKEVVSVGQSVWRCSVETVSERTARMSVCVCRIRLLSGDIDAVFGLELYHCRNLEHVFSSLQRKGFVNCRT